VWQLPRPGFYRSTIFKKGGAIMKIDKRLEGKGDGSARKGIMKLASDYSDPYDAVMDLMPDLMDSLKQQWNEMKEEGYSGSFSEFLKSEIDSKKKYRAGGRVK